MIVLSRITSRRRLARHKARLSEALASPQIAYGLSAACLVHACRAAELALKRARYTQDAMLLGALSPWTEDDLASPSSELRYELLRFGELAGTKAIAFGQTRGRDDSEADLLDGSTRALIGAAEIARRMAEGMGSNRNDADEMNALAQAALDMSRMATIGYALASGYSHRRRPGVDSAVTFYADEFERDWQADWLDAHSAGLSDGESQDGGRLSWGSANGESL
jgi:hypothetical protein